MSKAIRVKKGNEVLEIQDSDLQAAVKDGYLPTERIIVANSKTNESYEIDPQDLPNAFKDGFTYSDVKKKEPSVSSFGSLVGGGVTPSGAKSSDQNKQEQEGGKKPITQYTSYGDISFDDIFANPIPTVKEDHKRVAWLSNSSGSVTPSGKTSLPADNSLGGVVGNQLIDKQGVLDYVYNLKTPQEKEQSKPTKSNVVLPTTTPFQKTNDLAQTEEQAFSEGSKRMNEILFGDKWQDAYGEAVRGVEKAKDTKEALKNAAAAELMKMSIADNGYRAKNILANSFLGMEGDNNLTAKLLRDRAEQYDKVAEPFRQLQFQYGNTVAEKPEYDYNFKDKLNQAALQSYINKNPHFKDQLVAAGVDINSPNLRAELYKLTDNNTKIGQIIDETLNDEDFVTFIKNEKPEYQDAVIKYQKDLLRDNPDYGIIKVANKVSQEAEKVSNDSPIFSFHTKGREEFNNNVAERVLTPEEKEIWDSHVKNNQSEWMDEPSLAERFAGAGKEVFGGVVNTFRSPFKSVRQQIGEQIDKDASHISADPQGFSKFWADTGNALGIVASIGATGNVAGLQSAGVVLPFFGDMLQQGYADHPNKPALAITSAAFKTGLYLALQSEIFPANKISQAFKKVEPEIGKVVESLGSGAITREAARKEYNTITKKALDLLTGTLTKNAKITAELYGINKANQLFDSVTGLNKSDYERRYPKGGDADEIAALSLSNIFVAGMAKLGEAKKGNRVVEENLYAAASNPKRFESVIDKMAMKDPSVTKDQLHNNLKFLVDTKKTLDEQGIDPRNQARFLFEAIRKKVANEQAKGSPDAVLMRSAEDRNKYHEEIQQAILNGEDVAGMTPEQQILKEAIRKKEIQGGIYMDMAEQSAKDPEKAKQFLDEIKSQVLGEVNGDVGNGEEGSRKAWGNSIVDFLKQQKTEKEIEAAQPKEEPAVKLEKPTDEQQLKDINNGDIVSFTYNSEAEVPEVFKDKISSFGETNGKKIVRVTVAKSLADYELNKGKEPAEELLPEGNKVPDNVTEEHTNNAIEEINKLKEKRKQDLANAEKLTKDLSNQSTAKRNATKGRSDYEIEMEQIDKGFNYGVKRIKDKYPNADIKALEDAVGKPEGNKVPPETPQEKSGVSVIMPEDNKPPNVVPLVKPAEIKSTTNETIQEGTIGNESKPAEEKINAEGKIDENSQAAGGGKEPPQAPPVEPVVRDSEGGLSDKGVLNRLVGSKHISEEVRTILREAGLKYEPVGHQESQAFAKSIVDELGINEAVRLAEGNKFKGGTNTAVFAEAMNRLYDQEMKAKTPEEKLEIAKQAAEVGIRMDEFERDKGRDISQIAYFYKKSPLGVQMMENAKRKQEFDNWAKPKEKSWKEVFDEMMKEPEFDAIVKEQVSGALKKERAESRGVRKEKVHKAIDETMAKWAKKLSADLPPGTQKQGFGDIEKVFKAVGTTMKKAYDTGEAVVKIVQDAIDYISKELKTDNWDKEAFRKEWEGRLGKETDKSGVVNRYKRIEYLKKELSRIQSRKQKEKVEPTDGKRKISDEEQVLLDEIEAEQTKWDAEKDSARNAANNYEKLETERNRQLKRVGEINEKIDILRQGRLPETKSFEPKKDTPEIEALKAEKDALESSVRQSIAHEKKMKGLEDELQRLKDRKEKEPKTKNKREITEDERLLRDEIEAERKAWAIEDNINSLKEELERVKSRQKKTTNPSGKRELTAEEKDLVQKIKAEKLLWQKEVEPERKLRDALKATQKSIEEYERRIREKDISKKESDVPETPELKALRDKRDAKRKEYEAMKKEMKKPSDEEVDALAKKRFLDKLGKKLKGLSEKQKEEVVKKAFKQIVDAGGLEYEDFRKIIADVTGRGEMTPEQAKQLKDLVDKTNAVEAAAKKAQEDRTDKSLEAYYSAQLEAGKASRELGDLLYNKPDIVKRLTSIMQLNTLGVASLVRNPVYNIFNQSLVRFPVGLFNDLVDRSMAGVAKLLGKNYDREYNILETQGEFWSKLGFGSKEAVKQLFTGLNRMDYTQKEVYGQQIRPIRAMKDLYDAVTGKKKLTSRQVTDKALQATVGVPAEAVARVLNLGDKPQRFAAEGSQASAFAKMLGIKGIDKKMFMEFPKEEAYRVYKNQGLSEVEASKKAEYIYDAIIKEGERSTFQQDNYLNDIINRAFSVLGGEKSGWANLAKTLTISPYIKIPSNAFWSGYNLLNPEIAVLQSLIYGGASKYMKSKGRADNAPEMAMREARYWMGHAVAGIALRTVVLSLVSQGIFTPSSQKDDSKREREGAKFFTNTGTVDMGKLWAIINGEDPSKVKNGLKITNNWFGQFGYMGDAIARKYQDMTPEQKEKQDDFWGTVIGGMEIEGLKDMQNGVFANTSAILNAMGSPAGGNQYLLGVIGMAMNIGHPATLAQLSRAEMPYYTTAGSGDFMKKLQNSVLQRSSLLRNLTGKYPPSKIDIWGQTMQRSGSTMQKYFGISRDNPDAFARPLFEDYQRTGDIKFLPPAVYPNIGKEKLTDDQYARLQTYIGGARKTLVSPYVNDNATLEVIGKKYSDIKDDDMKLEILNYLYELGRKQGMGKFMSDFPQYQKKQPDWEQKMDDKILDIWKKLQKYKTN